MNSRGKRIANAAGTGLAWFTVALCTAVLLLAIATGVFYLAALALAAGAVSAMVALWKPGANPDRCVMLQRRG